MDFLIDGYNLLGCAGIVVETPGPYSLEASRLAVVRTVRSVLSEDQQRRTIVVFDGRDAPAGLSSDTELLGITVLFSDRGQEADDLLEELIRQHDSPRQLNVVSSDHRVQRAARRRRAQAWDSDVWLRSWGAERDPDPAPSDKPAVPGSAAEIEEWTRRCQRPARDAPTREASPPAEVDFPPDYLESIQDELDRREP